MNDSVVLLVSELETVSSQNLNTNLALEKAILIN